MIEKDIRKLLNLVEEKSSQPTKQLDEVSSDLLKRAAASARAKDTAMRDVLKTHAEINSPQGTPEFKHAADDYQQSIKYGQQIKTFDKAADRKAKKELKKSNLAEVDETQDIEEAMPMGAMSRLGQKVLSKLPTFAPQTATKASGKLETGQIANQLMMHFQNYLGKTGQKPTKSAVLGFLSQMGYPTGKAEQSVAGAGAPMGPLSPSASGTSGEAPAGGASAASASAPAATKVNLASDQRVLDTIMALTPQQLAALKQIVSQKAGITTEELDEAFADTLRTAGSAIGKGLKKTGQVLKKAPGAAATGIGAMVGGAKALPIAYQKGKQAGATFVGGKPSAPLSMNDLQKMIYSTTPAQAKKLLQFINQVEVGKSGGKRTPPPPPSGSPVTESDNFRKLLNMINEAEEPVLSSKQVSAMLLAAAQEAVTAAPTPSPAGAATSAPATRAPTGGAPASGGGEDTASGPSAWDAFKAGFGGVPPTPTPAELKIDFTDRKSLSNLVKQLGAYQKTGGKLNPKTKEKILDILSKL